MGVGGKLKHMCSPYPFMIIINLIEMFSTPLSLGLRLFGNICLLYTSYPVLRRLQKENFCKTYDEPYQGRNRRYYSITEEGRAKLEEYKLQWIDYKTAIETFLGDADNPVQDASDADDSASGTDNENQENLGGNDDE